MKELLRTLSYIFYRFFGGEKEDLYQPTPVIQPCGVLSIEEVSSLMLDRLGELGYDTTEIYLPDVVCKVYDKQEVVKFLGLDEVNRIPYVKEEHDCDDFAAILFGKFAGLVWTNVHALNWFIDETHKFWFIEPQTDQLSDKLEPWQGWEIRFLLGR